MFAPRRSQPSRFFRLLPFVLILLILAFATERLSHRLEKNPAAEAKIVRVLAYSAFINSWGPGPEIAKAFEADTGLKVEFQEGGDAGVLLKKLELFPADVVIGFDQLSLANARATRPWRGLPDDVSSIVFKDPSWKTTDFLAFDWSPLAFVLREGEIKPPQALSDLLDSRFKGAIAVQDPRTSSPGLQLFFWVLDSMGVDDGFKFLSKLKPNLHSVSANWSTAYGFFSKKQAKLAFSYLTSPVYHRVQEKDSTYQAAVFESGHPVQVEYAGVPDACRNCDGAQSFLRFLLKPETQKIIMEKNVMLPVIDSVRSGEFASVPEVKILPADQFLSLMERKDEFLGRWQELGL